MTLIHSNGCASLRTIQSEMVLRYQKWLLYAFKKPAPGPPRRSSCEDQTRVVESEPERNARLGCQNIADNLFRVKLPYIQRLLFGTLSQCSIYWATITPNGL